MDGSGTTTYGYDAVGNLSGYTYPNGVVTSYSYDGLHRLTQMGAAKSGALSSYSYTLGPAGNRTSVAELSGRTVNYGYDSLYRLTSETVSGDPASKNGGINYTYDAVGNRNTLNATLTPAGMMNYSYNANDQLSTDNYDANGNTVSSAGVSDSYDFENHLIQKGTVTMVYDGDGNRVSETVGGVTTQYLVDTQNPTGYAQVVDELQNGAVTRTYSYGLERISETQPLNGTSTISFYGYDGHGSVRQLFDSTGAITDTYDYDAFGNLINSTGSTPNNYLFAGEQFDPALNLYYNRARYLNTSTGRFWSMDQGEGDDEDPISLHKYLYAESNPVSNADPTGYDILSLILGQKVHTLLGNDFLKWAATNGHIGLSNATIKQILGYSVPGLSRFRPDLVDLTSHEVYEIKPIDSEALGYGQLGGYLIILNEDDRLNRLWLPGESYIPPFLLDLGDGMHNALVDPPFEGVITYQIVGIEQVFVLVAVGVKATQAALGELSMDVGVAGLEAAAGVP